MHLLRDIIVENWDEVSGSTQDSFENLLSDIPKQRNRYATLISVFNNLNLEVLFLIFKHCKWSGCTQMKGHCLTFLRWKSAITMGLGTQ